MCNNDHGIQRVQLECPDAIAILFEGDNHPEFPRQATMFYDLSVLAQNLAQQVLPEVFSVNPETDVEQAAYLQGQLDIIQAIVDANEGLVASSQSINHAFDTIQNAVDPGDLF